MNMKTVTIVQTIRSSYEVPQEHFYDAHLNPQGVEIDELSNDQIQRIVHWPAFCHSIIDEQVTSEQISVI